MEVPVNGRPPYGLGGRTDLERMAGERVIVRLQDGSEISGKLAGYYPTGFDLETTGGGRYLYFTEIASVRSAAA